MSPVALGRVYRCPVCHARIMVVRADTGELDPHCCNTPMVAMDPPRPVYQCDVCGSQVAVMEDGDPGELALICCHKPMRQLPAEPLAA